MKAGLLIWAAGRKQAGAAELLRFFWGKRLWEGVGGCGEGLGEMPQ